MWNQFTKESVVVMTTAKALETFMPKHIMQHPVKYHDDGFARSIIFGWSSLALYKPSAFAFEQEFRMILPLQPGDSVSHNENDKDYGRRVTIKLKKYFVGLLRTHSLLTNLNNTLMPC